MCVHIHVLSYTIFPVFTLPGRCLLIPKCDSKKCRTNKGQFFAKDCLETWLPILPRRVTEELYAASLGLAALEGIKASQ